MVLKKQRLLWVVCAAFLGGCSIRDVELDPSAVSAGGVGTNAAQPASQSKFGVAVAGAELKSKKYSMILTVGDRTGGNQIMKSKKYQVRQGFVGVSQ